MPIVVQAPQPPEEPLSATVTVWLRPSTKAALQALADEMGGKVSPLVRHWIEENVGKTTG